MENIKYSKILKKNWEIVALIVGVAVVLSLIISLLQPFQYAASTQILIIQKQDKNLDAYTATKSAERIGKTLSDIIFTSSFYNEVIESNSKIVQKFPQDNIERKKIWKKNVKADVIPETGILEIDVYDIDRTDAAQLVRTIAYVLVNKGSEYHGGGTDVEIKIVDDVFISKYPVRPNVILNIALAFIIGLLFGSALVILTEANKMKNDFQPEVNWGVSRWPMEKDHYQDFPRPAYESSKTFAFEPEITEDQMLNSSRNVEITTMYDHLQ